MKMVNKIHTRAYAKVNFNLNVLPVRSDGFHNIESIFQTINLYDELIVTQIEEKCCLVHCDSLFLPQNNTLTSAYQAFCDVVDIAVPGISVELKKEIPSGGGLGGGSSDAAALVRVLEKMCGVSLSSNQLDYIASKIGSDVFFFMHCDKDGKGCALISGRGEIVKEIKPRHDLYLLLIFPDEFSSTKEAYSLVDKEISSGNQIKCPDFWDLEKIYNSDIQKWTFKNSFTPVISNKLKNVGNAVSELKKSGCCYAEMSGSGSTIFGVFTLEQQAENVSDLLAESWKCKLVRTV